ncbi:MAG: ABC transporter substrate-binding protein [Evtepia gabavorous]|uniref:ABC transporter substrate-binding protein n=1 Tax=Evtepia gabavorous TaxID=2211183 RepID=UPI00033C1D89|nr:ABC transporter substrate-binding protein [Evtepia gabavorous]MDR4039191.1 ABC transporter substrate-binding protein [Evtepia sp.]MEE0066456.1 ABC transporter substrate-binding protein [Evtepia gabavorous]CCY26895.1 tat pathway signal sequence [Firmicutes bacterium CAG:114]
MKKFLSVLMAATMLVGVMALTGCGGDTTEPTTDEANNQSEPASTTATDLKTVTEGVLTMSTNAAFPPYESTDDSGNVVGIDADIAAAIAEKLGLKLQIDDMDFDGALAAPQSGKSDIVMAGVTVNEDRLLTLDFTESYATGVQVVIVPEGSDVTLDNLGEQQIGTQRGTTGYIYCTDDYGEDHVVAYDDAIAAVKALNNGQIDCVVIDSAPAQELVKANPGLTILDTEYVTEDYAIGVAKGNTALLDAVNGALKELVEDGTVQSIIDKYIPADAGSAEAE